MNLPQFVNIYKNRFYFLDDHGNSWPTDASFHFPSTQTSFDLTAFVQYIFFLFMAAQQKEMFLQTAEILGLLS